VACGERFGVLSCLLSSLASGWNQECIVEGAGHDLFATLELRFGVVLIVDACNDLGARIQNRDLLHRAVFGGRLLLGDLVGIVLQVLRALENLAVRVIGCTGERVYLCDVDPFYAPVGSGMRQSLVT